MLFRLIKRATKWVVPSSAAVLLLALAVPMAHGQRFIGGAPCPPVPCPAPDQKMPTPEPQPQPPVQPVEPTLTPEQFAATGGGESFAASAPSVIGDGGVSGTSSAAVRISAMKIAENESPRPQNRIYINYNYFNNINSTGTDVHREMPGFERTFLDGNASFGMRLPVYQTAQDGGLGIRGWGNLNMIGKYAFINDQETGNTLSSGMLLTLPTGREVNVGTSTFRDVVFTPFLGYFYGMGNFYFQGFSSVAVPTDARDITIMFNDLSAGYWAYRSNGDQILTGVIPTVETHINTPFNHRGTTGTFGVQDSIVMTLGTHFILNQRSIFTVGAATPVTGPQPFDVEGIAQFNYRY